MLHIVGAPIGKSWQQVERTMTRAQIDLAFHFEEKKRARQARTDEFAIMRGIGRAFGGDVQ